MFDSRCQWGWLVQCQGRASHPRALISDRSYLPLALKDQKCPAQRVKRGHREGHLQHHPHAGEETRHRHPRRACLLPRAPQPLLPLQQQQQLATPLTAAAAAVPIASAAAPPPPQFQEGRSEIAIYSCFSRLGSEPSGGGGGGRQKKTKTDEKRYHHFRRLLAQCKGKGYRHRHCFRRACPRADIAALPALLPPPVFFLQREVSWKISRQSGEKVAALWSCCSPPRSIPQAAAWGLHRWIHGLGTAQKEIPAHSSTGGIFIILALSPRNTQAPQQGTWQ